MFSICSWFLNSIGNLKKLGDLLFLVFFYSYTCQTHPHTKGGCLRPPSVCGTLCGSVWQVFKHQAASRKQASCIKQQTSSIKQQALGNWALWLWQEIKKSCFLRLSVSRQEISSPIGGCSVEARMFQRVERSWLQPSNVWRRRWLHHDSGVVSNATIALLLLSLCIC